MTFTKKQQELLAYMVEQKGYRLNPNGQEIYKSKCFYDMIKELKDLGLVSSFKKEEDGSSYQLTDKGIMFSSIIKDKINKTDKDKVFDVFDFIKLMVLK
jgi:Fe2+ or Zn2+ uptake regulation protein